MRTANIRSFGLVERITGTVALKTRSVRPGVILRYPNNQPAVIETSL